MKKTILFFIIGISCINCKVKINDAYYSNKTPDSLYTISRIDEYEGAYIVYAKKKNEYFKILTWKDSLENKCTNKIQIGKLYNLNLETIWHVDIKIGDKSIPTSNKIDCIQFIGIKDPVCLERDSIVDVLISNNLKGLCVSNSSTIP